MDKIQTQGAGTRIIGYGGLITKQLFGNLPKCKAELILKAEAKIH